MNIEAIKNRSKAEATKALKLFKWNDEQFQVLKEIEKEGTIIYNSLKMRNLFGANYNELYYDTETKHPISLRFNIEFNKGRRLFRKKDIDFISLF